MGRRIKVDEKLAKKCLENVPLWATIQTLWYNNRRGACVLVALYRLLNNYADRAFHTSVVIRESLPLIEKYDKPVDPRNLTQTLRTLERQNLIVSATPFGKKRPHFWTLTSYGRVVAECIIDLYLRRVD